jgi:hypothetical protein
MTPIDKILKEFDEKFPYAWIEWIKLKNDEEEVSTIDNISLIKSFIRSSLEELLKEHDRELREKIEKEKVPTGENIDEISAHGRASFNQGLLTALKLLDNK